VALTSSSSCGLSLSLLLLFLFLLSELLLFVLLSALVLLDHGIAMEPRLPSHSEVQKVIQVINVLGLCLKVKLHLTKQLRQE
jgi:hypothetical protein